MGVQYEITKSDDKLFTGLFFQGCKCAVYALVPTLKPSTPGAPTTDTKIDVFEAIKSVGCFIAMFFISFAEPFKYFYRSNIGLRSISVYRVWVSGLLFLGWATYLFVLSKNIFEVLHKDVWTFIAGIVFVLGGIVYIFLGLKIIIKGTQAYIKAKPQKNNNNPSVYLYRGDSKFYKSNTNKEKVWSQLEPYRALFTGVLSTLILGIGLPILISAIVFSINEHFQVNNIWKIRDKKIDLHNNNMRGNRPDDTPNQVK